MTVDSHVPEHPNSDTWRYSRLMPSLSHFRKTFQTAAAYLLTAGGLVLAVMLVQEVRTASKIDAQVIFAFSAALSIFLGALFLLISSLARRSEKGRDVSLLLRSGDAIAHTFHDANFSLTSHDHLRASYYYLSNIVDFAAKSISEDAGSNCAISIKILISPSDTSNEPLIYTLLRDSSSRLNREVTSPNLYKYNSNSVLRNIAENFPSRPNYVNDDLRSDPTYININPFWWFQYTSTSVAAITDKSQSSILGFFCVDCLNGHLDGKRTQQVLGQFANRVYSIIEVMCRVERIRSAGVTQPDCELGWRWKDNRLEPLNHADTLLLEQTLEHLEEVDPVRQLGLLRLRQRGAEPKPGLLTSGPKPQEADARPMASILDLDALVPDYALSDRDREIEKLIESVSPEEFEEILREIAPGNPYAEKLLAERYKPRRRHS